jgi:DNA polymerase III alpha subunit
MYINCKTYFSLNYGTFSTGELVQMAVNKGVTALTNINSTADVRVFVKTCLDKKVKPIVGCECRN